jgi:hypothetical protein
VFVLFSKIKVASGLLCPLAAFRVFQLGTAALTERCQKPHGALVELAQFLDAGNIQAFLDQPTQSFQDAYLKETNTFTEFGAGISHASFDSIDGRLSLFQTVSNGGEHAGTDRDRALQRESCARSEHARDERARRHIAWQRRGRRCRREDAWHCAKRGPHRRYHRRDRRHRVPDEHSGAERRGRSRAGEAMHEVSASISRVTQMMADISSSSLEQSTGIEQVNQAVVQMDEMTLQNAALLEQTAAAAASLHQQTRQPKDAIAVFEISDSVLAGSR